MSASHHHSQTPRFISVHSAWRPPSLDDVHSKQNGPASAETEPKRLNVEAVVANET